MKATETTQHVRGCMMQRLGLTLALMGRREAGLDLLLHAEQLYRPKTAACICEDHLVYGLVTARLAQVLSVQEIQAGRQWAKTAYAHVVNRYRRISGQMDSLLYGSR